MARPQGQSTCLKRKELIRKSKDKSGRRLRNEGWKISMMGREKRKRQGTLPHGTNKTNKGHHRGKDLRSRGCGARGVVSLMEGKRERSIIAGTKELSMVPFGTKPSPLRIPASGYAVAQPTLNRSVRFIN